jgi:dienelactone hydrolase
MYVTMARELAALGLFGSTSPESVTAPAGASPIEAHQADLSELLDWLPASWDVNEVVLIGPCSGADIALSYGHSDKRVVGPVLRDPTIPPTVRFYAHCISRRLTQLRSWCSFVGGRSLVYRELSARLRSALGATPAQTDDSDRKELEQLYLMSLNRNLKLLVVFTGGPLGQSYREQIFEALPNVTFQGKAVVEFFRDADHTFKHQNAHAPGCKSWCWAG